MEYTDADGNVLALRERVPAGTVRGLQRPEAAPGASAEDSWQRQGELLFESFAVSWTLAGLPLSGPAELLGRYRMADSDTRRWVRETLIEHARRHQPELGL